MEESAQVPSIYDVVNALAVDLDDEERTVDLIEIRRATDYQYMCKVYFAGESEFDSHVIRFGG